MQKQGHWAHPGPCFFMEIASISSSISGQNRKFCLISRYPLNQPLIHRLADQRSEQAVGPGEPLAREVGRVIRVEAFVHVAGIGIGPDQHIDQLLDLLIVIRRQRLHG